MGSRLCTPVLCPTGARSSQFNQPLVPLDRRPTSFRIISREFPSLRNPLRVLEDSRGRHCSTTDVSMDPSSEFEFATRKKNCSWHGVVFSLPFVAKERKRERERERDTSVSESFELLLLSLEDN